MTQQQQQHPITLPPELLKEIWDKFQQNPIGGFDEAWRQAMAQAAQWGADQAKANIERERQEVADQELEACRQWLEINGAPRKLIDGLLVARCRPKPPNLKDDAMEALLRLAGCSNTFASEDTADVATIRRALESIPDPS
jgi:hypothetical protein